MNAASRPVLARYQVLAHYQDANYRLMRGDRSPGYIFEKITGVLEPYASKNGARRGQVGE